LKNTAEEIASEFGTSAPTVKRAASDLTKVDTAIPEVQDAVSKGAVKLSDGAKLNNLQELVQAEIIKDLENEGCGLNHRQIDLFPTMPNSPNSSFESKPGFVAGQGVKTEGDGVYLLAEAAFCEIAEFRTSPASDKLWRERACKSFKGQVVRDAGAKATFAGAKGKAKSRFFGAKMTQ